MYKTPCAVSTVAQDGDTIEIDAEDYKNDVCEWTQNGLTLTGVNGRAKIDVTGFSISNGKGIWVLYGDTTTVENIEFSGASVGDNNGAGIRHQGLNLTVRNCYFHDNQDGILGAPATNHSANAADGQGEVLIESSEFSHNGAGDGYSHNMYLNHYAKFTLRGSWSHKASVGHLVKTRADENYILYNRITDEDGTASYEIDVPNGGKTYIIGNLIQQGASSQNPAIITYEEEGTSPTNKVLELYVVNNSIVNDLASVSSTFVKVGSDVTTPALLQNNIFVGQGTVVAQPSGTPTQTTNFSGDPKFVDQANFDYHLTAASPCVDKGTAPGMGDGYDLAPIEEYVQAIATEGRKSVNAIDIGAYELGGATDGGTGTGGGTTTGSSSSGGTSSGGTGGEAGTGGGAATGGSGTTGSPDAKSGCGCGVAGDTAGGPAALLLALGSLARRRRGARRAAR